MSITPEQRLANIEATVFGGPNVKSTPLTVLSADGRIGPGVFVITKATAAALTLNAPVAGDDDGKTLRILSTTAEAHTVTASANALNGNSSTALFGGAVGDCLNLMAFNGVWYVLPSTNVTLS